MTATELYEHITKEMTPEQALKMLLESSMLSYEKLKFDKGKEVHPIIIISMAVMELGWSFIVENDQEHIEGLIVGTQEYVDRQFEKGQTLLKPKP